MKQRLAKTIAYGLLAVSVFLTQISPAYAAETDETESADTTIVTYEVEGVSQSMAAATASLSEYDYQGATSIHTVSQYGYIELPWSSQGEENSGYLGANYPVEFNVPTYFRLAVEKGHTYSGQVEFILSCTTDMTEGMYYINSMSFAGFEQQSNYDGITCSYWGPTLDGIGGLGMLESSVWIVITFDNYQPTFTGNLNINMNLRFLANFLEGDSSGVVLDVFKFNSSVASDWAGTLLDYPTNAITDSDGSLIQNQTNQQQQIAQQQQQQSSQQHQEQLQQQESIAEEQAAQASKEHAEQLQQQESIAQEQAEQSSKEHDDLMNGYDSSQAESNQSAFNDSLSDFESQEGAILDHAMGDINNVELDTSVFEQLVPTFELIRVVFMAIVNALGDFGVLITITLSICLALFAIGWFRG